MSLGIDVQQITRVLLADGWHDVKPGTFDLDAYEYLWSGTPGMTLPQLQDWNGNRDAKVERWRDAVILHGGGQSGVCSTGFEFETPEGVRIAGPLTSILAVEYPSPAMTTVPEEARAS